MSAIKTNTRILRDETMMETMSHGSRFFPFQYYYENIWDFDFHAIDWHWHSELEMMVFRSGDAICYLGEDRLEMKAGSALIINRRTLHRMDALEENTIAPNIVFSPLLLAPEESLLYQKYIHPFLTSGPSYVTLKPAVEWQAKCIDAIESVFAIQESDNPDELKTVERMLALWGQLYQHFPANVSKRRLVDQNQIRLQMMMQYIHSHYRDSITLDEISASANVAKSTALQIFQHCIHISPISYLIRYRLKCAAALLSDTSCTLTEISEQTGFQSPGYFCRKFKELYQLTPKQYRQSKFSG